MSNILITTIGRRGALTKIFKQELNKIGAKVIVTDKSPLAPALYEADKYYLTPGIYEENYIDTILEICEKDDVKAIIPLLEQSFPVYNQARGSWRKRDYGSSYPVLRLLNSVRINTAFINISGKKVYLYRRPFYRRN